VYSAFLARLQLSIRHREALLARGLTTEAIARNGYRSHPGPQRTRIARELTEAFGPSLFSVPGFVVTVRGGRLPFASIMGAGHGILIPCRNLQGQIVGMKVRRDSLDIGQARYYYLSSRSRGGPGPGCPAHCPMGLSASASTIRVTEGELKSDVAWHLSGVPTISAPGVSNWRAVLPLLLQLKPDTVLLAFDADWQVKKEVRQNLVGMARLFLSAGLRVGLELWDASQGKGIDDLFAAGGQSRVHWLNGGRP
jgi:hypothetical protein